LILIRRAAPHELAACAALYERASRQTFTWFAAETIRAETFLADCVEEEVYVAVSGGDVVGLASFYRPDDFLHSLFVDEAWRGQGVGSALFAQVAALAQGPLSLKVQKLNTRAVAFYAARGLVVIEDGEPEAPGGGWFRMAAGGGAEPA
jgi:GNAT superfamily N-acetyltransferase